MTEGPIGIFDSGLGGLTVAAALFERLPGESTVYFGDTARVPYGPKSPVTVQRYSAEILVWLLEQDVKAIVVACNTSSAHAIHTLRRASPVPVMGVIEPGARAAIAATRAGRIGVIGTAGTVASEAYVRALHEADHGVSVIQQACPLFVPFVEEGWFRHEALRLVAGDYLAPLIEAEVDTLVLGCTHYPLLKPLLKEVMGPEVTLIDSAEATARAVAEMLDEQALTVSPGGPAPTHRFAVSDEARRFQEVGARFLGERLSQVDVVPIGG